MSILDISTSQERARLRFAAAGVPSGRRPRSDRGASRVHPRVRTWLQAELSGQDRPSITAVLARLADYCRRRQLPAPSRATVYKLVATLPTATHCVAELPAPVQQALYNLVADSEVPAHQVVFYCFNYGDLAAMSFAAGLPWLALYQARLMPGFRGKCRGLLDAVAQARGV